MRGFRNPGPGAPVACSHCSSLTHCPEDPQCWVEEPEPHGCHNDPTAWSTILCLKITSVTRQILCSHKLVLLQIFEEKQIISLCSSATLTRLCCGPGSLQTTRDRNVVIFHLLHVVELQELSCASPSPSPTWQTHPPAFQHAHLETEEASWVSNLSWSPQGGKRQCTCSQPELLPCAPIWLSLHQLGKPQWPQCARAPNVSLPQLQSLWPESQRPSRTVLSVLIPVTKYQSGWATKIRGQCRNPATETHPQHKRLTHQTRTPPFPSAPRAIPSPEYL